MPIGNQNAVVLEQMTNMEGRMLCYMEKGFVEEKKIMEESRGSLKKGLGINYGSLGLIHEKLEGLKGELKTAVGDIGKELKELKASVRTLKQGMHCAKMRNARVEKKAKRYTHCVNEGGQEEKGVGNCTLSNKHRD